MSLSKDIKNSIQANLPSMVASELQEFIAQSEELRNKYDKLKSNYEIGEEDNKKLKKQLEELTALKLNSADLANGWLAIKEEQRDLKVKFAEVNRDAAISAKNDIYTLVHGLFRNTEFRESTIKQVPVVQTSYDYNTKQPTGDYISPQNQTENTTKERV